ncbi:MAG: energy transducer TonB [Pirellulaceae bacterium]
MVSNAEQMPLRNSRLRSGLVASLAVHGICAYFTLGNYTLPEAQDRQRGSTAINLLCVALQQETEAATTAVIQQSEPSEPPDPLIRDESPVPTHDSPAPSESPPPKQLAEATATSSDVSIEQSSAPQIAATSSLRREPELQPVPLNPTNTAQPSRHPARQETAHPAKVETLTENQRTIVSRQSSGAEVPPTFARRPEPIYPPDLLLSGVEGSVQLLVLVGSNGKPVSVNIHRSSGYRQMDQSALDAVATWEFSPARSGATPIAQNVIVPVNFRIGR